MRILILAAAPLLTLAVAAPAYAQGATQSPSSPNSGTSMPEPPNSVPSGARTLPSGTTGLAREGNITTMRYSGTPAQARHRRAAARPRTNPDAPEGRTVPTPVGQ
jgi:hypothetical protein